MEVKYVIRLKSAGEIVLYCRYSKGLEAFFFSFDTYLT